MNDNPLHPNTDEEMTNFFAPEAQHGEAVETASYTADFDETIPIPEIKAAVEAERELVSPIESAEAPAFTAPVEPTPEPQFTAPIQPTEEPAFTAPVEPAPAPAFTEPQPTYTAPYTPTYQPPQFRAPYGYDPYTGKPNPRPQAYSPYTGAPAAPKQSATPPARKPKKEKKSGALGWKVALIGLCFALLGSVLGGVAVGLYFDHKESESTQQVLQPSAQTQKTTEPTTNKSNSVNTQAATTLANLYNEAVPSIVGVTNQYTTYNYFGQGSVSTGTGTGFIISSDGEILTNFHVIENAEVLTITMYDGTEYPAKVLGYEAESDVALLKIEAEGLTPVTLGDSDALYVGEQIAAIGNPLGELTYTMTVGYVSAKGRAVYTDEMPINMMQIDAAINPGNSGGPLFNLDGEVVGITTAKYSGTVSGSATIEGIGFAIPINDVLTIVDDLREYGSVQNRAYIGVTVSNSAAAGEIPAGALVQSIEKGSSGDKAGLRVSDIITSVGDTAVYGVDTLYQALRPYRGGDTVEITVFRSGETLTLTITFDSTPSSSEDAEVEATEEYSYGFPWDYMFP